MILDIKHVIDDDNFLVLGSLSSHLIWNPFKKSFFLLFAFF